MSKENNLNEEVLLGKEDASFQEDDKYVDMTKDSDYIKMMGKYGHPQTLDEPISDTIMRDLRMIGYKLRYVLLPRNIKEKGKQLRNWDMWGPFIICISLAIFLSLSNWSNAKSIFATVFVVIWVGAAVVTLNAQLLRGKISFFQSVCVLGYCICPIAISACICFFLKSLLPNFAKFIIILATLLWSTYSSFGFMAQLVSEQRKILAVYPLCLFYMFLAWFSYLTLSSK